MKDFFKYQLKNNIIYGICCLINGDSSKEFHIVKVINKRGLLDFEPIGEKITTTNKIKECIGNQPVFLAVDGKGVLLKSIKADTDKPLLKQIIPTAGEDEFILDSFQGEDRTYVSLARKEFLQEITEELNKAGIIVICVALGPWRTVNLIKYFDSLPDELRSGNYYFRFNKTGQVISTFEKTDEYLEETIIVDSREIKSTSFLALSIALEYYIEEDKECLFDLIRNNKREYLSKILFNKVGILLLVLIFVVLMVNTLLYFHFSDRKQVLENKLSGNQELKNRLDSLQKELDWKKNFLMQSGMLNRSKKAFYADRIAGTVPQNIILEKLEINPVIGKIRLNKEITLRTDVIFINGNARNSSDLNNWINKLKELSWVNRVEIVSYLQDDIANNGIFSLEIGFEISKR